MLLLTGLERFQIYAKYLFLFRQETENKAVHILLIEETQEGPFEKAKNILKGQYTNFVKTSQLKYSFAVPYKERVRDLKS